MLFFRGALVQSGRAVDGGSAAFASYCAKQKPRLK
jgi:hypothetical protein